MDIKNYFLARGYEFDYAVRDEDCILIYGLRQIVKTKEATPCP
jgi:hypothetical protein